MSLSGPESELWANLCKLTSCIRWAACLESKHTVAQFTDAAVLPTFSSEMWICSAADQTGREELMFGLFFIRFACRNIYCSAASTLYFDYINYCWEKKTMLILTFWIFYVNLSMLMKTGSSLIFMRFCSMQMLHWREMTFSSCRCLCQTFSSTFLNFMSFIYSTDVL